jgi:hypothetical protein
MTVKELVTKLHRFDPDAEVYVETRRCLEGTKEEIRIVRKLRKKEHEDSALEWPGVVLE